MIAYLDLVAGASGDMLLAALLDAGADEGFVRKQLAAIDATVSLTRESVLRRGLRASFVTISGEVTATSYVSTMDLLAKARLEEQIYRRAEAILLRLFEAEAEVHGVDVEQVHLHELSAIDTLGDVVGVTAAFASLEVNEITASPVPLGAGSVQTEHGSMPIPVPAVLSILRGVPTRSTQLHSELVTPTGAAILKEVVGGFGSMPSMMLDRVGVGAGARNLEIPNILRVVIGRAVTSAVPLMTEALIEANIDDLNPEIYQFAIEKLLDVGAADVWIVPAIGRHGRPLSVVSVLAPSSLVAEVKRVLFSETSTIGVRVTPIGRSMLERRWDEVRVSGHLVRIKVATQDGEVVNASPEYADCAEVARRTSMPLKEVFRIALSEWSGTPE